MFVVKLTDGAELTVPNLDVEDEAVEFRDPEAEEILGVAPLTSVRYAMDEKHIRPESAEQ